MGKIAPLTQITGLGYSWLKEQVGETLAFNYYLLHREDDLLGNTKIYYLWAIYSFILGWIEGILLTVLFYPSNLVQIFQPIAFALVGLGFLIFLDKVNGPVLIGRLYGLHRHYDLYILTMFFSIVFVSLSFLFLMDQHETMFPLFGLIIFLSIIILFFRFIEKEYLNNDRIYDRLIWLNYQAENEGFKKTLEKLFGRKNKFHYSHKLVSPPSENIEIIEKTLSGWIRKKNRTNEWIIITMNFLGIHEQIARNLVKPSGWDEVNTIFLLIYFFIWSILFLYHDGVADYITPILVFLVVEYPIQDWFLVFHKIGFFFIFYLSILVYHFRFSSNKVKYDPSRYDYLINRNLSSSGKRE